MLLLKILTRCFIIALLFVLFSCNGRHKTQFLLQKIYSNKIELMVPGYLQLTDSITGGQSSNTTNTAYLFKSTGDSLVMMVKVYNEPMDGATPYAYVNNVKYKSNHFSPATQILSTDTGLINGKIFGWIELVTPAVNNAGNNTYNFFAITFINNRPLQFTVRYCGAGYKKYINDIHQSFQTLKVKGL